VAEFNPVDWAIEAGRSAVAADPDWSLIAGNVALLTALLLACAALATRAFRSYQASV
jgi:ABC-2 type transport system permease protein